MGLPILSTKKSGAEKSAQALLGQANDLTNLLMNPNDPRYQAMLQNQTQSVRQGYLQNIRDLVEANRRQALMGRTQFFDPERRDESVFSAVNQAGQQAQNQARSDVINQVNEAIGRLQGQAQSNLSLAGLANDRNNQLRQSILALLGTGLKGANIVYNKPQTGAV